MTKITRFFFNGQEYKTKQQITLSNLLFYFDYSSSLFIIEYNNLIYNKTDWLNIKVQQDDVIELITIVGGG